MYKKLNIITSKKVKKKKEKVKRSPKLMKRRTKYREQ